MIPNLIFKRGFQHRMIPNMIFKRGVQLVIISNMLVKRVPTRHTSKHEIQEGLPTTVLSPNLKFRRDSQNFTAQSKTYWREFRNLKHDILEGEFPAHFPGSFQDISRTCPRHFQDISGTYQDISQDISTTKEKNLKYM